MAQSQMAPPPAPTEPPRQKSFVRDTLEIVFLALVLYVVIQYAVQTVHVLGSSMYPSLHDNDLLVASKISYKLHAPQRGDIIVFKPPDEASRDFIKRIIALPGERIRISNSVVYINGQVLQESYLPEKWTYNNNWPADGQDKLVPPGEYFVMGDNRNHSSDSRTFSFISLDAILGKAEPGTIRGDLALDLGMNLIHGSDSPARADAEMALFFSGSELHDYERTSDRWIRE